MGAAEAMLGRDLWRGSRDIAVAKTLLTAQTDPRRQPARPRLQFLGRQKGMREKTDWFLVLQLGICRPPQPTACRGVSSRQAEQPDPSSPAPTASLAGSPNEGELQRRLGDRRKALFCCCSESLKGCEDEARPNSAFSVTGGGVAPPESVFAPANPRAHPPDTESLPPPRPSRSFSSKTAAGTE